MAVRLIECHRVLKPAGSLFLHCDHTANSYLRVLLDAIFGKDNFCNEIIWHYLGGALTSATRVFPRKHDTIFFYAKGDDYTFANPREDELSDQMRARWGKYLEADGCTVLYGSIKHEKAESERARRRIRKREGRDPLDDDVAFLARPSLLRTVWNIPEIRNNPKYRESTGYPTQKPPALAERIIKAASNEGDLVLDPFAGCAYTAVAAESLGRRWMACDISPRALTVMRRQFAKKGWAIDGVTPEGQLEGTETLSVTVRGPAEVPTRDHDPDPVPSPKPLPERRYKVPASDMPKSEMKDLLGRESGWQCWACGYATRTVNGDVVESGEHFHLDHIEPRSQGGSNLVHNMALLCAPCNSAKGAQRVPLKALRDDPVVRARRESYGIDDYPVDIDRVQEHVMVAWANWRAEQGLAEPQLPGIR